METLTTTAYVPTASHAQESNLRGRPTMPSRTAHAIESHRAMPASQDSAISAGSDTGSAVSRMQSADSTASRSSQGTDSSSVAFSSHVKTEGESRRSPERSQLYHDKTPEERTRAAYFERDNLLASPMSLTSPIATNGAKRTASGHIKNAPSLPNTPYITFNGPASRRASTSSTGSRAGELAASLKTRLGYAMAKVQHGWEHKSLEEVEQLAARRSSSHHHWHSVSLVEHPAGRHGVAVDATRTFAHGVYDSAMLDHSLSPPSKRQSAHFSSHRRGVSLGQSIQLQPPLDLHPAIVLPASTPSQTVNHQSRSASPPRTPVQANLRRPTTIRTETQTAEAERDALQALFQLGSPQTSQGTAFARNHSQEASTHASPLRFDTTPRRVMFARSDSDNSMGPPSSTSSGPNVRDRSSESRDRGR